MRRHVNEKKQREIRSVVSEVIGAYRRTGEQTDPLGMYTGIARDGDAAGHAVGRVSLPDTGTPTEPVPEGKRYRKPGNSAEPVQDADDL